MSLPALNMLTEDWEHLLVASFLVVVGLIAIIGNSSILLVVYRNTNLRTPANFCLVNLAVANILQGLIAVPFRVLALQKVIPCVVIISFVRLFHGASNLALSLVSLDRFAAVTQPFYYHPLVNTRRTTTAVVLCWTVAASISLLPIAGWGKKNSSNKSSCICNFPNTVTRHFFWLNESLLTFVPLLVMVFSYVCIFTTSRRHILKIQEQRSSFRRKNASKSKAKPQINRQNSTIFKKRVSFFGCIRKELQVIKVITVLAGIFVVLVVPSEVVNIVELWKAVCVSKALRETLLFLDYSNACVSALVYAGFSSEYRETFRRMWIHWKDLKDISARCRLNSNEGALFRSRSSSTKSHCESKDHKEHSSLIKETKPEGASNSLVERNVLTNTKGKRSTRDYLLTPTELSSC